MRIRLRRPRFNAIYILFAVILACLLTVTLMAHRKVAPLSEDYIDPVDNRLKFAELKNRVVQDAPPIADAAYEYTGPFPDSKAPEGFQSIKIDYHNYTQIAIDKQRKGLGEQGKAAKVPAEQADLEKELYSTNGFNGQLSELLALDRSLPDIRHQLCSTYTYYKELPTVSVVIPFFEEQWSTLLRTVVSVYNRSPRHLLREILLVDDGSTTRDYLGAPLERWLAENVPIARVIRLPEREGLITARQTGAEQAKGDVIVVLDSHCEVMINWLPPLLHPIAENYRTTVCPLIDIIAWDNFAYRPQDNGARGGFDWNFFYKRIPLLDKWEKNIPQPFPNPVMNGGLFAISRKFFWELGGYDPGLKIWGGEQYNLSFKIWQCGGTMLDAPCSRVGHVFRGAPSRRPAAKQGNMTPRNYKRVALVWMDEYVEALFQKNPSMRRLDAGDITGELAIREKLQCKPFKWFIDNVAPDIFKIYPPFEPADFANGTIKNIGTGQCIDNGGHSTGEISTYPCHGGGNQQFHWCWREFIRIPNEQFCIESPSSSGKAPVLFNCHNNERFAKQRWKYNPNTRQLVESLHNKCLEAVPPSKLVTASCSVSNTNQQWEFSKINYARIREEYPEFR